MKRDGYIMDEITDHSNISAAIDEVLSSSNRKNSAVGRDIIAHRDEEIEKIANELRSGHLDLSLYFQRDVFEHGKLRHLQVLPVRKRIAINAVMRVVDRHIRPRFIRTTGASIQGRGMHDLMAYIRDDIRRNPADTQYCLKLDISKFYESINQDSAMQAVSHVFKDPTLLSLLSDFIHFTPQGLSIGLRSSQGIANLLLSIILDHYFKDQLAVPYYYRYCDDVVFLGSDKKQLWQLRDLFHQCLASVSLSANPNERLFPTAQGIDFLGYVIYPTHVALRKRIKQNMARRMASVKSRHRRDVLIASFYGITKHADCNNLFKTLTGKEMKSFKDLGVSYAPADGKKHFPGVTVSIRDLVNLPIIIRDFETGIKTDQGDDRTLVAIEHNGEPKKFFTASIEMRNILEQIRDLPDGFPFETTIKTENFGKGKTKYIFT